MDFLRTILAELFRLVADFIDPKPTTTTAQTRTQSKTIMPIDPITGGEEVAAGALTVAGKVIDAEAAAALRKNQPAEQQAVAQQEGLAAQEAVIADEAKAEAAPTPANIEQLQKDSSGVPLP